MLLIVVQVSVPGRQTVTEVVGVLKDELALVGPGPTISDTTLAPPPEKLCPLLLPLEEPLELPELLDDEPLDDPELPELPDEEALEPLPEELPLLDDEPGEEVFVKSSVST